MKNIFKINNNIYVVSDEDIKSGDWYLCIVDDKINNQWNEFANQNKDIFKKIILTNDQKLIDFSIQKLDEDFLDWFSENPDCEIIETIYGLFNPMGRQVEPMSVNQNHSECVWKYKTIIPNNTVKPNTDPFKCENFKELGCVKDVCSCLNYRKQETIERADIERYEKQIAAHEENYCESNDIQDLKESYHYKGRRDECVEQQERNYSKEDLKRAFEAGEKYGSAVSVKGNFEEWFEHNKKQQ